MQSDSNWILDNTGWFYNILVNNSIFYIDYWSVVHFLSGMLIFILICSKNFRRRWLILFAFLFGYELFELLIKYFAFNVFKSEIIKDQAADLIIGMFGGITQLIILKSVFKIWKKNNNYFLLNLVSSLTISVCIAFIFAGYNSHYSTGSNLFTYNLMEFFLISLVLSLTNYIYLIQSKINHSKISVYIIVFGMSASLIFGITNHSNLEFTNFNFLLSTNDGSVQNNFLQSSVVQALVLPLISIFLSKTLESHTFKAIKNIFNKTLTDENI